MAQVPYQPFVNLRSPTPTEQFNIQTTPDLFGANIGRALEQAGVTTEGVGEKLFAEASRLQSQDNEFAGRTQSAVFDKQGALKQSAFRSLPGDQQAARLESHIQDLTDLRQQLLGQLPNKEAQLMFDRESQPFLGRMILQAANESSEAFDKWRESEAAAASATKASTVHGTAPGDFEANQKEYYKAVEDQGHFGKFGPEWVNKTKLIHDGISGLANISYLIDTGKIDKAKEFYESHPKVFADETVRNHALEKINRAIITKVAGQESFESFNKNETEEQLNERVARVAEENFPGDSNPIAKRELEDNIRNGVYAKRATALHRQQTQSNTAIQNMWKAFRTSYEQGHDLTSSEFKTKFQDVYNQLSEKQKGQIETTAYGINRALNMETEKETMFNLKRLFREKPHEFMEKDIYDPNLKISFDDRSKLLDMRGVLLKQGTYHDRYVQDFKHVMLNNYEKALEDLGIKNAPGKNESNPTYDEYIAEMGDRIQDWMERNQAKPTDAEFLKDIAPQLLHIRPAGFLDKIGDIFTTHPQHWELQQPSQTEIEQAWKDTSKDYSRAGRAPPNINDVMSVARGRMWKRLQEEIEGKMPSGGTSGAGAGPSTGPAPGTPESR